MAKKLAFGEVLAGLAEGIAEGVRFNKQIDLKERELALREQNSKDAALFREEQFGLSKERFEVSQKQFKTREGRLERGAEISAGREAFNQGDDLRRDLRGFDKDLSDVDQELFQLLRSKEIGGEESPATDSRIQSLNNRRSILEQERESMATRLETLNFGSKSPERQKATEVILKSQSVPLSKTKQLTEQIALAQNKGDLSKIFRAIKTLPISEKAAVRTLILEKHNEITTTEAVTGIRLTSEGAPELIPPEPQIEIPRTR